MQSANAHAFGGSLVAPAGDLPHTGLEQILDRSVSADRIAVNRGIAAGKLRLVARGDSQKPLGIRICHDNHTANTRLQVLSGHTFKIELLLEGDEQRFDG